MMDLTCHCFLGHEIVELGPICMTYLPTRNVTWPVGHLFVSAVERARGGCTDALFFLPIVDVLCNFNDTPIEILVKNNVYKQPLVLALHDISVTNKWSIRHNLDYF